MTEKIEWDEKYSVDVPEIDKYQKELFDKFNELIDMRASKKMDPKVATNLVSDLNDYTKMFFNKEESLLKRKKYPDLDVHAKAHRQFIKNSIGLRREIAEDINNLSMDVIVELRDWLVDHIETSDSLYVPFLRINQYIEDCRKK
ncbi:MAG TPA: chemotaxis protein [Desulfobacteraceae bacterium]|nr:chemotaxis protein [Desulfobacteraceae bacterium]